MAYLVRALTFGVLFVPAILFLVGSNGAKQETGSGRVPADAVEAVTPASAKPATGPAQAAGPAKQEVPTEVKIDNFAFSPRTLTVAPGTKVTWVNHDDVPHTATSTAKPRVFDSDTLDTDGKFAFVFKTPGTYAYFCAVHPHMTGTIIVK